jgi:hypothetical protein
LKGLNAHYHIMSEEDYELTKELAIWENNLQSFYTMKCQ